MNSELKGPNLSLTSVGSAPSPVDAAETQDALQADPSLLATQSAEAHAATPGFVPEPVVSPSITPSTQLIKEAESQIGIDTKVRSKISAQSVETASLNSEIRRVIDNLVTETQQRGGTTLPGNSIDPSAYDHLCTRIDSLKLDIRDLASGRLDGDNKSPLNRQNLVDIKKHILEIYNQMDSLFNIVDQQLFSHRDLQNLHNYLKQIRADRDKFLSLERYNGL